MFNPFGNNKKNQVSKDKKISLLDNNSLGGSEAMVLNSKVLPDTHQVANMSQVKAKSWSTAGNAVFAENIEVQWEASLVATTNKEEDSSWLVKKGDKNASLLDHDNLGQYTAPASSASATKAQQSSWLTRCVTDLAIAAATYNHSKK